MKEKINYDVDIDSSRLLYKLKQVVDEYQDIYIGKLLVQKIL